jgi:hypothetical protein
MQKSTTNQIKVEQALCAWPDAFPASQDIGGSRFVLCPSLASKLSNRRKCLPASYAPVKIRDLGRG